MAAWVIRQEREGEPIDAFQLEEIEVPEPGAFEVIVRVMAAGVNFNNVWAALRQARLGLSLRTPGRGPPHRRLRRLRHRLEGRRGRHALEARRRGRHPLQPGLLRGPRGPRPRPARRALAEDLGLRDDLGLLRAVHARSRPSSCCPSRTNLTWEEAASYGLDLLHRLPHADRPRCELQAGHRVLIWGAAGGLGVFATQLCAMAGAECGRRRLLRREGRAGQAARRRRLHRPQRVRGHDAQGRRDARGGEGALQGVAARSPSASRSILGEPPDIVFEHVGQATFPTSVLDGQAVRQGRHLRRHVRLQPRLRRALPVDAPEGDHRLALRQRVGVQRRPTS